MNPGLYIVSNRKSILTMLCLFILSSGFGQYKNFIDQPYIEVSGSADTLITPNIIHIRIVISEKDTRDKVSLEEQENKMVTAFTALGINTEKDLTTSDMLSNYQYYLLKQKDILKSKEYILKVTTAELASKVFIKLEDLGISNASIQSLDHTDIENFKNICRVKAIENAQKRAVALTKPISQTIGNAIHISDNETNIDNALQGRAAGVVIRGYGTTGKEKASLPAIDFEKIKVNANVNVKFILK